MIPFARSFAALALSIVCGCSGVKLVAPESLAKPAAAQYLELRREVTWEDPVFSGMRGLAPGRYAAEYEDEDGTYFRGPSGCVFWFGVGQTPDRSVRSDGGVWIPKASSSRASLYMYQGSTKVAATGSGTADPAPSPPAVDEALVTNLAVSQTPKTLTPAQGIVVSGVGGGLSSALIGAAIAAEQGKIRPLRVPEGLDLASFFERESP